MALIKCPECGREISTSADVCPHCGYPIAKQANGNTNSTVKAEAFPNPISSHWVNGWKEMAKRTKILWTIAFLASLVGLIVSLVLLINDKQTVYYSYLNWTTTESKPVHIAFTAIFGTFAMITFSLWIGILIGSKVRTRQYDGYTILVYAVFKHILVIENKVQDTGIINRYLYGQLPNKKQVWASISNWDGSVKIGIGRDGDERNII